MSEATEGWDQNQYEPNRFRKLILGNFFECVKHGKEWRLVFSIQFCATRPTLEECQQLAHDTARLWAGESE